MNYIEYNLWRFGECGMWEMVVALAVLKREFTNYKKL